MLDAVLASKAGEAFGGNLGKSLGSALGGGPATSGGQVDARGMLDGSGWTVATGSASATGANQSGQGDPFGGVTQAGGGVLGLAMVGLFIVFLLKKGKL
jgi:hypothetical protein